MSSGCSLLVQQSVCIYNTKYPRCCVITCMYALVYVFDFTFGLTTYTLTTGDILDSTIIIIIQMLINHNNA